MLMNRRKNKAEFGGIYFVDALASSVGIILLILFVIVSLGLEKTTPEAISNAMKNNIKAGNLPIESASPSLNNDYRWVIEECYCYPPYSINPPTNRKCALIDVYDDYIRLRWDGLRIHKSEFWSKKELVKKYAEKYTGLEPYKNRLFYLIHSNGMYHELNAYNDSTLKLSWVKEWAVSFKSGIDSSRTLEEAEYWDIYQKLTREQQKKMETEELDELVRKYRNAILENIPISDNTSSQIEFIESPTQEFVKEDGGLERETISNAGNFSTNSQEKSLTNKELKLLLAKFGIIDSVKIIDERFKGKAAEKAISQLIKRNFQGNEETERISPNKGGTGTDSLVSTRLNKANEKERVTNLNNQNQQGNSAQNEDREKDRNLERLVKKYEKEFSNSLNLEKELKGILGKSKPSNTENSSETNPENDPQRNNSAQGNQGINDLGKENSNEKDQNQNNQSSQSESTQDSSMSLTEVQKEILKELREEFVEGNIIDTLENFEEMPPDSARKKIQEMLRNRIIQKHIASTSTQQNTFSWETFEQNIRPIIEEENIVASTEAPKVIMPDNVDAVSNYDPITNEYMPIPGKAGIEKDIDYVFPLDEPLKWTYVVTGDSVTPYLFGLDSSIYVVMLYRTEPVPYSFAYQVITRPFSKIKLDSAGVEKYQIPEYSYSWIPVKFVSNGGKTYFKEDEVFVFGMIKGKYIFLKQRENDIHFTDFNFEEEELLPPNYLWPRVYIIFAVILLILGIGLLSNRKKVFSS